MASDSLNYRLTEGKLTTRAPTKIQLWNAANAILVSQKRSTYKFALLQSIIDLSVMDKQTVLPLEDVFKRVTEMYWRCLSRAPMRQVYQHARYEKSDVEKIILSALSIFPGASFAELPAKEADTICRAIQKSCRRIVLGAAYGNSNGVIFGFSNQLGLLELSLSSKSFLSQYASGLSKYIERGWLLMMKELNPDCFPESFTMRLQTVDQEIDRFFKKEVIPMTLCVPATDTPNLNGLQHIQTYIEEASGILDNKAESLERSAAEFEKELKAAFPDGQKGKLIFQSRVKGTGSLAEKIYRKNYHNQYPDPADLIDHLPDLIGVRIVCLLNQQEELIFYQLKKVYSNPILLGGSKFYQKQDGRILFDFSDQPQKQKNGQPIYRISCKWKLSDSEYINCELQIKSMVHFFWGELDHMLFYKNYSYLISRSFYSQYMLKVENALSNVNDQLVLLCSQIEKDGESSRQEIREIASCMLYQHYHAEIEQQIRCMVDLREVFDLIVDMHFQNYGNQYANINKLSKLLHDIPTRSLRSDLLPVVMNRKLDRSAFTQEELSLAKIIDQTIKTVDVYWLAFVVTYGSHFWDEESTDYSQLLREICRILIRMLRSGFIDSVEQLYDELDDLYEQFKSAILKGILSAFEQKPKLDFFIFSAKLDAVNSVSQEIVQGIQGYLTNENAEACQRNMRSVTLFTHCKISASLYEKVPSAVVSELNRLLDQEDAFNLRNAFDDSQIPYLTLSDKDIDGLFNEISAEGGIS